MLKNNEFIYNLGKIKLGLKENRLDWLDWSLESTRQTRRNVYRVSLSSLVMVVNIHNNYYFQLTPFATLYELQKKEVQTVLWTFPGVFVWADDYIGSRSCQWSLYWDLRETWVSEKSRVKCSRCPAVWCGRVDVVLPPHRLANIILNTQTWQQPPRTLTHTWSGTEK